MLSDTFKQQRPFSSSTTTKTTALYKAPSDEVINFCLVLILAGNETTKNLIGNALLCFDEYPDVMEQIQEEPALLPGAIEEVLRYLSPVPSFPRMENTHISFGYAHRLFTLTIWQLYIYLG